MLNNIAIFHDMSRDLLENLLEDFPIYNAMGKLIARQSALSTDSELFSNKIIWFYQLSRQCKLATVKRFES